MSDVSKIEKSIGLPYIDRPIRDDRNTNYLLILMLLQSTTADMAMKNQEAASKKRSAAIFSQGVINAMGEIGDFSPDTADSIKAFLERLNSNYDPDKLSYSEALVLKQMNQTFAKLDSLKSEMQKIQKEIKELKDDIEGLEKDKKGYQKEIDSYLKKYKRGGAIVPGYNVYLGAKIIEYRNKKDNAEKKITEKTGEINLKKIPELNALKAEAFKIQKGFESEKKTEAQKAMLTANDEMAQAAALFEAAMSSDKLIKI